MTTAPRENAHRPSALQTLYDVGRALASTLDYEAVLEQVMDLSRSAIGSETASVMLADEATGNLLLVCAQGLPEGVPMGAEPAGGGVAEWVYRHGEAVMLHGGVADDARFQTAAHRGHIRSALSVPLVGKRGPIGVLSLNNANRAAAFTGNDLDLLAAVGAQAGIAVENARLHRQVSETNRQLTVTVEHLRNLKESLTSMTAPSLEVALGTMLDAAVDGTSALAGALTVLSQGDATYQIEVCYHGLGLPVPMCDDGDFKAVEERILCASSALRQAGIPPSHSMILVLTAEGREIGLLKLLAQPDGPGFNEDDREFVDALVEHASIVVFNSLLYQEAEAGRAALQSAYAELQEKQDQLIQSEKLAAIGQLAAKVCHEINNPLTGISGLTQLMRRKLRADETQPHRESYLGYLDTIVSETERCARITGDLLNFARKQTPRFVELDLHDTLSAAIALTEVQYPCGIETAGDFDFTLPRLTADPQQLMQVFLNLLSNGVQAMPDGGRLTVRTRCEEDEAGCAWARVEVQDDGAGLDAGALRHLFDPFFTTKPNGTGLGLAISRGIVERHKGKLTLEPGPAGRGAVAIVRLPLCGAAGMEDESEDG